MRLIAVISLTCLIGILNAQSETCDKFLECKNAQRQHELACDELDKDGEDDKNRGETDRSLCKAEVKKIKETVRDLESQRFEMEVSCIIYNKNNSAIAASREARKCQRLPYFVPPNLNAFVIDPRDGKRHVLKKRLACKKSFQATKKLCKKIAKCCPSDELCNLEYELSGTHDKIAEVNKDAFMKNIECLGIPKHDNRKKFDKWNRRGKERDRRGMGKRGNRFRNRLDMEERGMGKRRNGLRNRFDVAERGIGRGLQKLDFNNGRGNRKGGRGNGKRKDWKRNGLERGLEGRGRGRGRDWKLEGRGGGRKRGNARGWNKKGNGRDSRGRGRGNGRRNRGRWNEDYTDTEAVDEGSNVDDLGGMIMIDDVDVDDDEDDIYDHDHYKGDNHDHDHGNADDAVADSEERAFVAANLQADTDEGNDFGLNDSFEDEF